PCASNQKPNRNAFAPSLWWRSKANTWPPCSNRCAASRKFKRCTPPTAVGTLLSNSAWKASRTLTRRCNASGSSKACRIPRQIHSCRRKRLDLSGKGEIRDWLRISSATVGTNGKKGTLMVLPQSTRGYLSHPKFTCHRTRFSASLRDFKTTNAENDVRCGSEGDIVAVLTNVRYTLKSSIAVRRRHVRFVPMADISHIRSACRGHPYTGANPAAPLARSRPRARWRKSFSS